MNLSTEAWALVERLFHEVVDLSPEARASRLAASGAPPEVIAAVQQLVAVEPTVVLDDGLAPEIAALLSPTGPAELPTAPFGPYRVIGTLGDGGMGVVYLARRDDVGAEVALKVLWDAPLSPLRRARFDEEQRILATLRHPGIVPLYDAGQADDGTPWFAMEHVDGAPITQHCATTAASIRHRLQLFRDVCLAVRAAHERLIVHGDLKPANILVTREGRVRLLDFGIASRLDADDTSTPLRHLTPAYAAPERRAGEAGTVSGDVFALGVILVELLTGSRPTGRVEAAHLPAERGEDRNDLAHICRRATASGVEARYPSVEALLRDVERYLGGFPLDSLPASMAYSLRKFVRRRRAAVVAATLVLAAGTIGLVLHNRTITAARDAALLEVERTTRLRQFLENLFQGGQAAGTADSVRVATLVANGIREARALTMDPAMQMELLESLAIVSEGMATYGRADSLIREAVAQGLRLYGPEDPRTLQAQVRGARLLIVRDSSAAAERELRRVIQAFRPADQGHPAYSEAWLELGKLLRVLGRTKEGIDALRRAVAVRHSRDTLSIGFVEALRELGNAAGAGGELALAESTWTRGLPLARRLLGPTHPQVAFLHANLGHAASQRGALDDAIRDRQAAVDILAAWYGIDHYFVAAAQYVLAQTLVAQGRIAEADSLVTRVIDIYGRTPILGPTSPNYALAVGLRGTVRDRRGDLAAAREDYTAAAALLRRAWGPAHKDVLNLEASSALATTGDPAAVVTTLQGITARADSALGPRSLHAAQLRLQLATALSRARRYEDVIALSVPALQVVDSIVGPNTPSSAAARETLAAAFEAVGDTARARSTRQAVAAPGTPR
ncbi:MAG: serine/threonine protein kinase [Gemmatimonadetes bacterium]|nr:serine/threonine protein kinase [Gemmatimonadota bacterium]